MFDCGILNGGIFARGTVLYEHPVSGQNCWKFSQLKKRIYFKPHVMFLYLNTAKKVLPSQGLISFQFENLCK